MIKCIVGCNRGRGGDEIGEIERECMVDRRT